MSCANFDEIYLICCDWESVSIRPKMIKVEKSEFKKGRDLISLIADNRWESGMAVILNDQEHSEVGVFL